MKISSLVQRINLKDCSSKLKQQEANKFVEDANGEVSTNDSDITEGWKAYFDILLKEDFTTRCEYPTCNSVLRSGRLDWSKNIEIAMKNCNFYRPTRNTYWGVEIRRRNRNYCSAILQIIELSCCYLTTNMDLCLSISIQAMRMLVEKCRVAAKLHHYDKGFGRILHSHSNGVWKQYVEVLMDMYKYVLCIH